MILVTCSAEEIAPLGRARRDRKRFPSVVVRPPEQRSFMYFYTSNVNVLLLNLIVHVGRIGEHIVYVSHIASHYGV